jgi:hypothetical protein
MGALTLVSEVCTRKVDMLEDMLLEEPRCFSRRYARELRLQVRC